MREQNVSSFEEVSRAGERQEEAAVVEDRGRTNTLAQEEVGRRGPELPQGRGAAKSRRSDSQQPTPNIGFVGLVLTVAPAARRGNFQYRLGNRRESRHCLLRRRRLSRDESLNVADLAEEHPLSGRLY